MNPVYIIRQRERLTTELEQAIADIHEARVAGDTEREHRARDRANRASAEFSSLPTIEPHALTDPYRDRLHLAMANRGPVVVKAVCSQCQKVCASVCVASGHFLFTAELPQPDIDRSIRDSHAFDAMKAEGQRIGYARALNAVLLDVPKDQRSGPVIAAVAHCPQHQRLAIDEAELLTRTRKGRPSKVHRCPFPPM